MALRQGDPAGAAHLLQGLPSDDRPTEFLRSVLAELGAAPDNWDGVLSIEREGAVRFKSDHTTRIDESQAL